MSARQFCQDRASGRDRTKSPSGALSASSHSGQLVLIPWHSLGGATGLRVISTKNQSATRSAFVVQPYLPSAFLGVCLAVSNGQRQLVMCEMEGLALGAIGLGLHGSGKCREHVGTAPTALMARAKC